MERLNEVEIETRWGYRTIELYCGDLTKMEDDVDVLAVSSFSRNYEPVPGTLIGALKENCTVDVLQLAEAPEYDFRDALGCWIARVNEGSKFGRIVCVDLLGGRLEAGDIIENLFVVLSILEMKGVEVRSLALPVLGAGNQSLDPAEMIRALLTSMHKHRDHFRHLMRVLFIELNQERAAQLDKGINEHLGRIKLIVPKGQLFDSLRTDIRASLAIAEARSRSQSETLFSDLRRLLTSEQSRWFEIGMMSRKFVEYLVESILPAKEMEKDLWKNIDRLHSHGIARWITSYMHVLRVFGNESAHELTKDRQPPNIDLRDMAVCLFCVKRLLEFWNDFERAKRPRVR